MAATKLFCDMSKSERDIMEAKLVDWENNEELRLFRNYLRIPTAQPEAEYDKAINFLKKQAEELELPYITYYPANERNPILVITWAGIDARATGIMLTSYLGIHPFIAERYSHSMFGAEMDSNSHIFGIGTQSMKSTGILYLSAIKALKKEGVVFRRTFHVVFLPDRIKFGEFGLKAFVKSDDFKALRVGFCLDEGSPSADEKILIYNDERSVWQITLEIPGPLAHTSVLTKNTAAEKLQFVLSRLMEWRQRQADRLEKYPETKLGDVSSVNVTCIDTRGCDEEQTDFIPTKYGVCFDVYFSPDEDQVLFEALLQRWCQQEEGEIEVTFDHKGIRAPPTCLDKNNLFWMAFQDAINVLDLKVETQVNPNGTNISYIREAGIPTVGFSPFNNTPQLPDTQEEYIDAPTYLNAICIYKEVITKLGNASKCYCGYVKKTSDQEDCKPKNTNEEEKRISGSQ